MPWRCSTAARTRAQRRMEDIAVDGVVDDVQLRFGQPEAVDGFRRAPSSSCRSPPAATGSRTAASRRAACSGCTGDAARRSRSKARRALQALLQPHRVHAVAGAIDVAAEQPLVRFDEVGLRAARSPGMPSARSPIRAEAARVPRVADHGLDQLQLGLRPRARVERDRDVALEQRFERALEEALGAAPAGA